MKSIGIKPSVSAIITTFDGGKAMVGWGQYDGMIMVSWVTKLWGATGAINCGSNSKISGYVEMSTVNASAEAACLTNTQWFLNSTYVAGKSVIWLEMAESSFGTGTVGTEAYIYCVGGHNAATTYGLGNWWTYIVSVTFDGAVTA